MLVSLSALVAVFAAVPVAVNAQDKSLPGRELAATWCSACHNIEGLESNEKEAPSFGELSKRTYLNREFISDWVARNNHPLMPNFNISADRRQEIASYLLSFRNDGVSPDRQIKAPDVSQPDSKYGRGLTSPNEQDHPGRASSVREATGTGFFVSARGEIITASHVVGGCQFISIWQGRYKFRVTDVSIDDRLDLALLRTGRSSSYFVKLGQGHDTQLGEEIYTIGLPLPNVLTNEGIFFSGDVSATKGALEDNTKFQVSMPALPGSSGSPVIEKTGMFAGTLTSRINRTILSPDARIMVAEISYAIKASEVMKFFLRNSKFPRSSQNRNSVDNTRKSIVGVRCENLLY